MHYSGKPLALLLILTAIASLLLGVNVGRYVERSTATNKPSDGIEKDVAEMQKSSDQPEDQLNAPSGTNPGDDASAQNMSPYMFSTFNFEECGVSFLIPSNISQRNTADDEAEFRNQNASVFVSCDQDYVDDQAAALEAGNSLPATPSARIASQSVDVYSVDSSDIWIIRNSARRRVLFDVSDGMAPLIKETLRLL